MAGRGELLRVARAMDRRTDAVVGVTDPSRRPPAAETGDDGANLLLSGFDLDVDGVCELADRVALASILGSAHLMAASPHPEQVAMLSARGLWVNGLAFGLMLAEQRAREAARA